MEGHLSHMTQVCSYSSTPRTSKYLRTFLVIDMKKIVSFPSKAFPSFSHPDNTFTSSSPTTSHCTFGFDNNQIITMIWNVHVDGVLLKLNAHNKGSKCKRPPIKPIRYTSQINYLTTNLQQLQQITHPFYPSCSGSSCLQTVNDQTVHIIAGLIDKKNNEST